MREYRYARPLVRSFCVGVLSLMAASQAAAQPSSNSRINVVVNGAVNAAVRIGNTLYIGGAFSRIAPSTSAVGSLVAVNPATGQVVPNRLPLLNGGDVNTMVPDGVGGYYVGGGFDRVGTERLPSLMHVNAAGQKEGAFVVFPSSSVRGLALAGGHLWVGGDFTQIGGQARQRLAALDPATGVARNFTTDANAFVTALAVSGTRLFVAGNFTQIAGQARNRLAAFDVTTGALLPWNPGADGQVNAIVADATTVYVGGQFANVGGVARARLAAIDAAAGTTVMAFAPPAMTNNINRLALSGTTVYAGGNLVITGATPRNNAAAFDTATGALKTWNPTITGGAVNALTMSGNTVYIGGGFSGVGGQTRTGMVAVDATSAALFAWNPGLIRSVNAIEIALGDGAVIAGGGSNATNGQTRFNLAAIDLISGNLLSWAPGTNNQVFAMIEVDSDLVVGGAFTMVNGQPRNRIAVFENGGDLEDFNPGADNTVNAFAIANEQVYVGGLFTNIAGQPRSRLASFSRENGELTSWAPNVAPSDASVTALEVGDGVIYAGGFFTAINGVPRNSLAAIDVSSGAATAFNANLPVPSTVLSLARSGQTLYVGHLSAGLYTLNAASGAPTGQLLTTFQPTAPIRALAVYGNTLYIGGGIFTVGAVNRRGLGALDLSQSPAAPTSWDPDAGYNVNAIYAFSDIVVAVGNFSRGNPVPAAGIGVWERTSGPPAPPPNFQADAFNNLASLQWTAPALGPAATGYTLEVGSTPTSGNDLLTMPLGNVTSLNTSAPTGTYYVRLRATNASGQSDPTPTKRIDVGCTAAPGPVPWFSAYMNGNTVSLDWDKPSGNIARYILEVGSASGLSNILTTTIAAPTTFLEAVAPPGIYYLRVKAANVCGTGAASSETFIVVSGAATLAGPPQNLTATVSGSNVSLSWTPPASGSPPTGYVLEAGTASGLANIVRVALGPATTFSTAGVPPGTYYVRVRPLNAAGIGAGQGGVVVVP